MHIAFKSFALMKWCLTNYCVISEENAAWADNAWRKCMKYFEKPWCTFWMISCYICTQIVGAYSNYVRTLISNLIDFLPDQKVYHLFTLWLSGFEKASGFFCWIKTLIKALLLLNFRPLPLTPSTVIFQSRQNWHSRLFKKISWPLILEHMF